MCYNTPMKKLTSRACLFSVIAGLLFGLIACSEAPPPVDPEYAAEIEEWRAKRLARLTADSGWLTVTGLFWLEQGENLFGSAEDNPVVLPDARVPEVEGRLVLDADGAVTAIAEEGATVTVNDEPLAEVSLKTDAEGPPDIVTAGRIRFYVIDREGRLAARVKDPEASARTTFKGIEHFPINESYRVEARLEPYESPREVAVPTELGLDATYVAPGTLHFTVNGEEQTLEPYFSGRENELYFLIFRDATSAATTYGAGRFLYVSAADESGTTVLDFNYAYSPPCAFTPYATCPLAPPQNWLEVPIEAGEKYSGAAH
jgi:uncharacterized protein (DUF1684 family)